MTSGLVEHTSAADAPKGFLDAWWWDDLDPVERDHRRAPLPGDRDADVVVVGAGFTGLWTAYYLLRSDPTLRVVVLEKDTAGAGASGRNGGWCSAILPVEWDDVARRHGRQATLAWQAATDQTLAEIERVTLTEGIDAHYARGGYLRTASNPAQLAQLDQELAVARRWGRLESDLERLTADEARALINTPRALGGLFTPHCAALQPARLVRGLARVVEARGAAIHEGTTALRVEPRRVVTDRGTVRADAVVQALEGYTAALRGARRDVLPLYSVMIATEPLDDDVWSQLGWAGRQTFHDGRRHLFYAQRTQDGRIAFGGRGAPYRYGSRIDDPVRGLGRLEVRLRGLLVEQFPSLHDVAVTHRWGGVLAVPRDWMPSVRYDARRGTAVAGGYSGDGVALANLAGRTVADLVTGTRSPLLDLPWVGHVSSRWEPEPLRWLGTSVGEWLATAADRSEERSARPSRVFGPAFSWLSGH